MSATPLTYRLGESGVGSVTYLNGTAAQIARVEKVLYNNLPNGDYRLWTFSMERSRVLFQRDVLSAITNNTDVVEIEFVDSDANPGDGAHTFAFTQWFGPDAPIHIKLWESEPNMQRDDFFRETVAHEFGHVATFLLMEALGVDAVKQTLCNLYDLPVSRWDDPNDPWEKHVIEAVAEFFKDVMVPADFREFDNRTEYTFPSGNYVAWLNLFVKRLYNMNAGSEEGPFFRFTMVDGGSGTSAGTDLLSIAYQNGNFDNNINQDNPALNLLRYPVLPVSFEADLNPPNADYVLDAVGFANASYRVQGGYHDLHGVQYDSFDTGVLPMPDGTLNFTVPAASQPGDFFAAITFTNLPRRWKGGLGVLLQKWGTLWTDHIWARLPDHERFSAWSPGVGLTLPEVDDTKGRPPYPTYFPPYPYDVPEMGVGQGPKGSIRRRRGVTGQESGKPLGPPPAPVGASGEISMRQSRGLSGTVRH